MSERADVLVVGAGIVGAAIAASLARAGLRVEVLERAAPAGGTTAAGMGHVLVLDDSPAQLALTRRSRELWREREWCAAVEFAATGTLWLARDDEERDIARTKAALLREHRVPAEVIDAATLRRLEPRLAPDFVGALRLEEDCVVYPPAAVFELLAEAERRGARTRRAVDVRRVGAGFAELADGTRLEAGAVVVAAGLGSRELLAEHVRLPLFAKKGHLAITDRTAGLCSHQLVELGYLKSAHGAADRSVAFNVQPRSTGQVLVGSSRQVGEEDLRVERDVLAQMLEHAFGFLPALREQTVLRVWTGLRPSTPDHLPLIGPVGGDARLLVAAGHEGHGITTSLGTAELVTSLLGSGSTSLDPAPYRIERTAAGAAA